LAPLCDVSTIRIQEHHVISGRDNLGTKLNENYKSDATEQLSERRQGTLKVTADNCPSAYLSIIALEMFTNKLYPTRMHLSMCTWVNFPLTLEARAPGRVQIQQAHGSPYNYWGLKVTGSDRMTKTIPASTTIM